MFFCRCTAWQRVLGRRNRSRHESRAQTHLSRHMAPHALHAVNSTPVNAGKMGQSAGHDRWLVHSALFVACALGSFPPPWGSRATAAQPLHEQIDRLIAEQANDQALGQVVDDAGFLRRVSLDFAGRIPAVGEIRFFLADRSVNKRQNAIDRLLAGAEYSRHMAEVFHVLLMERLGDNPEWMAFLRTAFEANRPLDRMFAEILLPDREDERKRGAAFFYSKRLEKNGQNSTDYPGLTRDVGRLFLGVDLQCAQCHDHLTIDEYEQRDFQGLFAVYRNLNIDNSAGFPAIIEKPLPGKLEFASVFEGEEHRTGPRVPFGREFDVPSDKKHLAGYSPLSLVAPEICNADNSVFSRNIANRIWFLMMGLGLVHPLDEHHAANPPSHPALLELLAREFVAHRFDLKWMLRELALSETYQRTTEVPGDRALPNSRRYAVAVERRLSAEQLFWSTLQATGELERLQADAAKAMPSETSEFSRLHSVFAEMFGNPPRVPETEIEPSVKGALFLLNDERFLALLDRRPGNLADRLTGLSDWNVLADELFLSILSRFPGEEERALVARELAENAARKDVAVRNLVWALLAGTEFHVNH